MMANNFWDEEVDIAEIGKGRNTVKFSAVKKGDREYVSVREWFTTKGGEERPTKKGIVIPKELVEDYVSFIEIGLDELET